jgi:enoyl-[acyl-carrier protein] reductase I
MSYAGEVLERRVKPLAESIGCTFVEPCDVTRDEEIERVAAKAKDEFGEIDILIHSIAFADRDDLVGPYYDISREGFHLALDISAFSFTALAKAFQPMIRPGGALLTVTMQSDRVFPGYNVMGIAKAALDASVMYLANDFGPQGIRVNAISAGPIRTLAAMGVGTFKKMYKHFADIAPLRQNITTEDVGDAAVFLCSDLASKTTGEIMFVDSGMNFMGAPPPPEE